MISPSVTHPLQSLDSDGFARLPSRVTDKWASRLKGEVFESGQAGKRCLLNNPLVAETAKILRSQLSQDKILTEESVAIQAIAFDKTPDTNWKVTWHQDLMFPFANEVTASGYTLASVKDGIHFAQPPLDVLNELLAVRLHLDDCHADNGPLRVAPGSHRLGVIPGHEIRQQVDAHGEVHCHANEGDLLLLRPLLLHASSQASSPNHRRVLHFVFHSGPPVAEQWAQVV